MADHIDKEKILPPSFLYGVRLNLCQINFSFGKGSQRAVKRSGIIGRRVDNRCLVLSVGVPSPDRSPKTRCIGRIVFNAFRQNIQSISGGSGELPIAAAVFIFRTMSAAAAVLSISPSTAFGKRDLSQA
jgi:hypothetical protein